MKIAVGLAIALCALAGLDARQVSGRWAPSAKIPVWIGESTERKDDPELVERAMKVWSDASNGAFTLSRIKERASSKIRVQFASGDALLGETSPLYNRATGYIGEADVAIANNLNGDRLMQRIVVYMTALHELGHALGMRHTTNFSDIMYYFTRPQDPVEYFGAFRRRVQSERDIGSRNATGLSSNDLDRLRELYK